MSKLVGLCGKAGSGKDALAAMIAPVHLVWMDGKWHDVDRLVDPEGAARRRAEAICGHAVQLALADPLKTAAREFYDFSYLQLWSASEHRNKLDRRYPRLSRHVFTKADSVFKYEPTPDVGCTCKNCGAVYAASIENEPCTTYLTPREALQKLGTEYGRACYANTWIDLGIRRAKQLLEKPRTRRPDDGEHFASSWIVNRVDLVILSDVRFQNEVDAINAAGGEVWKIMRSDAGLKGSAGAHISETEQDGIDDTHFANVILNDGSLDDLRRKCAELLR